VSGGPSVGLACMMSLLSKLGHSLSIALWPTLKSRKAKEQNSIALFSCFFSVVCLFVWLFVCLLAALWRIKIYIRSALFLGRL